MIQYKYFHTSKGYIGRLSIGKDSRDFFYHNSAFDNVRSVIKGEVFAYAVLGGGTSILMQSGTNSEGVFAHGINVDSLNEFPCQFIDRLDTDIENAEQVGDQIPDAPLPTPLPAPSLPAESRLYQFVPKIVDALINGAPQKKILIHTDDMSEAQEFLSLISAVLPHCFMMRVGFCVGANAVSSADIKVPRQGAAPDTATMKIWIPRLNNYKFENYANTCYVFDVESGRDNYNAELGKLASVLSQIDIRSKKQVAEVMHQINGNESDPSFAQDGSVNTKRLDVRASNVLLRLQNNPAVARDLLKQVDCKDAEERSTAATAIAIVANANDLNSGDLESIINLCFSSIELCKESVAGKGVYAMVVGMIAKYDLFEKLSPECQTKACKLITNSNDAVGVLYDGWPKTCTADYAGMSRKLYDISLKLIKSCEQRNADSSLVKKMMYKYFSVNNNPCVTKDCVKGIVGSILEAKEIGKSEYELLAMLLAKTVDAGVDVMMKDRTEIVKEAFKKLPAMEQFGHICRIKEQLVAIGSGGTVKVHNASDFPFDSKSGEGWCRAIIGVSDVKGDMKSPVSDSIEELIKFYINSVKTGMKPMADASLAKLTEMRYVKEKLKKFTDPGYEIYRRFIRDYIRSINKKVTPVEEKEPEEIEATEETKTEEKVNLQFSESSDITPGVRIVETAPKSGMEPKAQKSTYNAPAGKSDKSGFDQERFIPKLDFRADVKDTQRNALTSIRSHLIQIEKKKRSKKFGTVAKLCRCLDAYESASDKDKDNVRRGCRLDDDKIDNIFCLDQKSQKSFMKASSELVKRAKKKLKEEKKLERDKKKARQQQMKAKSKMNKANNKPAHKSGAKSDHMPMGKGHHKDELKSDKKENKFNHD